MQIVIDIPKKLYKSTIHGLIANEIWDLRLAVANGMLLPKGHGKLIDADELTKEIKGYISDTSNLHYNDLLEAEAYNSAYYNCLDEIEDAPTIIEAESEDNEDDID